jgi:DNA-binding MltR family transcriptional regulator
MVDDGNNEIFMEFAKTATKFQISLRKESERGSAIVCAALLDESLREIIKAKLVALSKKKDELFDGGNSPLESASAKIDLAYRIGLISRDEKSSFHLIRKIRNKFAHSSEEIHFDSSIVKDLISELFKLNKEMLNIFAKAVKRIPKTTYSWPKNLENEQGLDFLVKAIGWKTVYEMLGSIMAAAMELRCRRIEQLKPYRSLKQPEL